MLSLSFIYLRLYLVKMQVLRKNVFRPSSWVIIYFVLNSFFSYSQNQDTTAPTLTLSHTDSDNIVFRTEVVTITATFSEPMQATPTINISGEVNNALMINGNDIVLKPNNGWVSSSNSFNSNSNPYLFKIVWNLAISIINISIKILIFQRGVH